MVAPSEHRDDQQLGPPLDGNADGYLVAGRRGPHRHPPVPMLVEPRVAVDVPGLDHAPGLRDGNPALHHPLLGMPDRNDVVRVRADLLDQP